MSNWECERWSKPRWHLLKRAGGPLGKPVLDWQGSNQINSHQKNNQHLIGGMANAISTWCRIRFTRFCQKPCWEGGTYTRFEFTDLWLPSVCDILRQASRVLRWYLLFRSFTKKTNSLNQSSTSTEYSIRCLHQAPTGARQRGLHISS